MRTWKEYLLTVSLAIFTALFVRVFILGAYKVPTGSMQPTLKPGDFIFSNKTAYGLNLFVTKEPLLRSLPQRGDLVVFSYPQQPFVNYVKRIIGLPGDKIELKAGHLKINEQELSYAKIENDQDNPNADLFEIWSEKSNFYQSRVILGKSKDNQKDFGPIVVPPDEVFVLGDNRDASDDSRFWGTVPLLTIKGKVSIIWMSLDWQKKWAQDRMPRVRWERFFESPH